MHITETSLQFLSLSCPVLDEFQEVYRQENRMVARKEVKFRQILEINQEVGKKKVEIQYLNHVQLWSIIIIKFEDAEACEEVFQFLEQEMKFNRTEKKQTLGKASFPSFLYALVAFVITYLGLVRAEAIGAGAPSVKGISIIARLLRVFDLIVGSLGPDVILVGLAIMLFFIVKGLWRLINPPMIVRLEKRGVGIPQVLDGLIS